MKSCTKTTTVPDKLRIERAIAYYRSACGLRQREAKQSKSTESDPYLDDAVEDDVVVLPAARELDEVPAGLGRVLVVHLNRSGGE